MHLPPQLNWVILAERTLSPGLSQAAAPGGATDQAILTRAVAHVPDVWEDPEFQVWRAGAGDGLSEHPGRAHVPGRETVGAIAVTGASRRACSPQQVELLKTFADQAVIAIENVRLFKELQARTGELTRSVDQLTALGEISRAVGSTLDVETVLTTIVFAGERSSRGSTAAPSTSTTTRTEEFHIRAAHETWTPHLSKSCGPPRSAGARARWVARRRPGSRPKFQTSPCRAPTRAICGDTCWPPATGRCSPCRCSTRDRSSAACR